jgi:hypothetical protein
LEWNTIDKGVPLEVGYRVDCDCACGCGCVCDSVEDGGGMGRFKDRSLYISSKRCEVILDNSSFSYMFLGKVYTVSNVFSSGVVKAVSNDAYAYEPFAPFIITCGWGGKPILPYGGLLPGVIESRSYYIFRILSSIDTDVSYAAE